MFQHKCNEIDVIFGLGYRAKTSWLINIKILHILQLLSVDIWWKLQSSIFKAKPKTEGLVNFEIVKSVKTFWPLEPKPAVGQLAWFFLHKMQNCNRMIGAKFQNRSFKYNRVIEG